MTRDAAERITRQLLAATHALNEALTLVQTECPSSFFNQYRRHAGHVLGSIYLDLIKPVVERYPDLDPGREE